jgi:LPS-assembly protein
MSGVALLMNCRLLVLCLAWLVPELVWAQQNLQSELTGTSSRGPVEITADGETRFENGVAISQNHVVIHYEDIAIYCEYAEYNTETHEILLKDRVRIYRGDYAIVCDRAVYNLVTKRLDAADFAGARTPFQVSGDALSSYRPNEFNITDGSLTTSDSSKPDYHIRARTIRIYPNDRAIMERATLYVGQLPVFWFPYLYQSLTNAFTLEFSPGENGTYGAYLLTSVGFPVGDHATATLHLNPMSSRGVAVGLDLTYRCGDREQNIGRIQTFGLNDLQPNLNETSLGRQKISPGRYRLSYDSQTYLTSDTKLTLSVTKMSDQYVMQDYYPFQFQTNPQPDNFVDLVNRGEAYTLAAFARYQVNKFFETTERLPEFSWSVARTPLFNSPIFYESVTSGGYYQLAFTSGSPNPDYNSIRIDSFHQFTYPKVYFGWLSLTPRVGFRGTYYSKSGTFTPAGTSAEFPVGVLDQKGARGRFIFNTGLEGSFKLTRAFEGVQSRWLGLDGLRHVIEPYMNFAYVDNPTLKPQDTLQFDRFIPSTQVPTLDFPQFTAIDSINTSDILRVGVRNRLETRRDSATIQWLSLDTFLDYNIKNPYGQGRLSDLQNRFSFSPVPWLSVSVNAQVPIEPVHGYWEADSYLSWMPHPNLDLFFGDRYIDHFSGIPNGNQFFFQGYYRLDSNWGFSVYEQYEFTVGQLQRQRYILHRDLSSWIASLDLDIANNGSGKENVGLYLILTLKDLPQFGVQFDVAPGNFLGNAISP